MPIITLPPGREPVSEEIQRLLAGRQRRQRLLHHRPPQSALSSVLEAPGNRVLGIGEQGGLPPAAPELVQGGVSGRSRTATPQEEAAGREGAGA